MVVNPITTPKQKKAPARLGLKRKAAPVGSTARGDPPPSQRNVGTSRRLAKRYRRLLRPQQCFDNARLVLRDPDLIARAPYVEGWCVGPRSHEVFSHGWLELDGKIIDPTLPDCELEYFAGLRLTAAELDARIRQRREPLDGSPLGWSDLAAELAAHKRAFKAACASADRQLKAARSKGARERRRDEWAAFSSLAQHSLDPVKVRAASQAAMQAALRRVGAHLPSDDK
jgi:hypothetical protein